LRCCLSLPVVIAIVACAPTMVQIPVAPADMQLATDMLGKGTSTVKGSALMRQRGGGVVTCAGNDVFLIPATPSASSELQRVFHGDKGWVARGGDEMGGGKLVVAPTPNRAGVCNAQGFFTFTNVKAGKWYVMTTVIWTVGNENQGGTMLGSAEVSEGQEAEIVLSQ
jgi:hypothetical protein